MDGGDDNALSFKLRHPWEGSEKKVLKAAHKIKGVRSAEIDKHGYLHIYGAAVDVGAAMRKLKKLVVESPELPDHDGGGSEVSGIDVKFKKGFLSSLFRRKRKMPTIVLGGNNSAGNGSGCTDKQSTCSSKGVEIHRRTALFLPMPYVGLPQRALCHYL